MKYIIALLTITFFHFSCREADMLPKTENKVLIQGNNSLTISGIDRHDPPLPCFWWSCSPPTLICPISIKIENLVYDKYPPGATYKVVPYIFVLYTYQYTPHFNLNNDCVLFFPVESNGTYQVRVPENVYITVFMTECCEPIEFLQAGGEKSPQGAESGGPHPFEISAKMTIFGQINTTPQLPIIDEWCYSANCVCEYCPGPIKSNCEDSPFHPNSYNTFFVPYDACAPSGGGSTN